MTFQPPDPDAYYAAGWRPPEQPRDAMAVASFVTGLCAVGPVAVALGLAALGRVRRAAKAASEGAGPVPRGRGFAIAGIALGAVWTLALGALATGGMLTWYENRPLPATITEARTANVSQLVTGSCVESLPHDGEVSSVRVVPCDRPHGAQVLTTYAFGATTVWPGQQRADERVAEACEITDEERAAGVRLVTWAPTHDAWSRGDRTGLCLATVEGDGLTGSFLDGSVTIR